jgi:hypothetical protein
VNNRPTEPAGGGVAPGVEGLVAELRAVGGSSVRAVLLYGSRLLDTSPDRHSAVDLVVIVDDERSFYESLAAAGRLHRPVWLMTALGRALTPNVLAYAAVESPGLAKYLLVQRDRFAEALGPTPPDHFLLSRMIQRVGIVWTADANEAAWLDGLLSAARADALWWVAPYLSEPVDAEGLGLRMLEVCYQGEFRPESTSRAARVFEAQRQHFRTILEPVLERAAEDGVMRRAEVRYELTEPVPPVEAGRVRRYFRRSKARATLRWLKHTVTFVDWLPYIERKVERHTGRRIELTRLERALPVLFLWPRVLYVLLTRPRKELRP